MTSTNDNKPLFKSEEERQAWLKEMQELIWNVVISKEERGYKWKK